MKNIRKEFTAIALSTCLSLLSIHAEPYFGKEFTYYQPNGATIQVRLYGDEFYAVAETLSGHVVIRDKSTGFLCYADLNKDGTDYVSTGRIIETSPTASLNNLAVTSVLPPTGLRLTKNTEDIKHAEGRSQLSSDNKGRTHFMLQPEGDNSIILNDITPAPPSSATVGNRVGLVLLIEFPDRPQDVTISQAEVDAYCNEPGYTEFGNKGSVRDYFYNQSDGNLTYNCLVTAYYTAENNRDYYTDDAISYGTRARELIKEALDHLKAEGFDFSRVDGNNDGTIDGVNTFYAGTRVNDWSKGLWPHKSGLTWNGAPGGINSYMQYQITDMTASLKLGTFCHENGHMLCDFPDLYVYESTQDPKGRGVGAYSLMCNYGYSTEPVNIDAYLKYKAGWSDIENIDSLSHLRGVVRVDRNHIYRFANPSNSKEYFLIETRQKTGYESSTYLRDQGLTVWHIDEDGSNTHPDGTHYELSLEQADGLFDLEDGDNSGGAGDLFHNGDKDEFADTTSPNAHWWNGNASLFALHSISSVGNPMTFIIGSGALSGDPDIGLDDATLEPVCDYGTDADSQTVTIWNTSTGIVNYLFSDNAGWVSLSPVSGAVSNESDLITVTYDTDSLAPGTYAATITVTNTTASTPAQMIPISLTVFDRPVINLSTNSLSQEISGGTDAAQQSFTINNNGGGTLNYSITSTQSWVTISPASGVVAMEYDTRYVNYDTVSLPAGIYHDTLVISDSSATNSPQTIPILITITGTPEININLTNIVIFALPANTGMASMVISNSGDSDLSFQISSDINDENYTYLDSDDSGGPAYSWIDISGLGTNISLADDGASGMINIGFDFPFYGDVYNQFQIGANGGISFSIDNLSYINSQLPSEDAPAKSILPFWDDLNPSSSGSIRYHGTAARLVVSWLAVPRYSTSDYETFQVIIYPDGKILYQYKELNGALSSCTVGIQNDTAGTENLQMIYDSSYLKNNFSIEMTPPVEPWLSWLPAQGTIAPSSSTSVWFTGSSSNLSMGTYTTVVTVACNDPVTPTVLLPLTFTVSDGDIDEDGLPDWWETEYYGGMTNSNPTAISSNGINTTLEAYVAGLDPTDPEALFLITQLDNSLTLHWNSVSGRLYSIYWSSNLLTGFIEPPIASNITAGSFNDSTHTTNNSSFYRIKVELAP